ncbi:MAG: hypothetical protein ACREH5_03180 [Candidatus Omnitrophota bacterium]
MAEKNGIASKVGLMLLGIGTAAGVHSALSPSIFTFHSFARSPEAKAAARKGLFLGLGVGSVVTLGVGLAFPEAPLAWIATGAGFLVFAGLGFYTLESNGSGEPLPPPPGSIPLPQEQKSLVAGAR